MDSLDRSSYPDSPHPDDGLRSDWITKSYSIMVIGVVLFILIFGSAIFHSWRQIEIARHNALTADKTTANLLADFTLERNKATIGILQSYANRPLFVAAVKNKDLARAHRHMADLKKNHEIDLTFVTDTHGILWANFPVFPEAIGKDLSYRDWYKGISSNWKPYISTVFKLIVGDKPLAAAVCVPIFDEKERVIGILASSQRLDYLDDVIHQVPFSPYTTVNVIDRAGQILYSNKVPYQEKVTDYQLFPIIEAALNEKKQQIEINDPQKNQEKSYLSVVPVGDIGWSVVIERSLSDVYKSELRHFIETGVISCLLFFMLIVFLIYLKKTSILRKTEELRKSEEKYRFLAEKMIDMVWTVNMDLQTTYVSPSIFKVLGFTQEERMKQALSEVMTPESIERVTETFILEMERAQEEGVDLYRSATLELEYYHKDGSTTWFENVIGFIVDDQGNPIGIHGVSREISERKRAEDALRESEELFRSYLENAPDGIYMNDLEGTFLYGNRKCEEITGYRREELIGKNFIELNLLPENSLNKATKLLQGNMEGKSTGPDELDLITKGGRIIPIEINTNVIQRRGQRVVLATVRDITERKQAEEALKESEERYRSFTDSTSDIAFLKDDEFKYIMVNQAYLDFYNCTEAEILGKTYLDGIPEKRVRNCHASDIQVRESNKIVVTIEQDENRIVETRKYPVRLKDGKIGFGGIVRDITDRKRAEYVLRESQQQLKAILDNIPDIAWLKDKESRFVAVNEPFGKSCGFEPEDLAGKTDFDIWPRDLAERYRADDKEVMESGKRKQVEETLTDSEGKALWIETIKTPIYDEHGNVTGTAGIARDITERKRAEESLMETLERLRKAMGTTIQVMISAIEVRDPYTAGHQLRSTDLARAIATEMGLSQDTIEAIRMAGPIHDIGKLSIPAEILSKPTKLTEIEFSLIKEHARTGYEMLKDVESPWPLAEIIYQHHERMDGSGYPRNLKGDEILMEARIMAVADVVESMASHRPYRPALGLNAALEEIENHKGTLYDADAADACLRLFREKGFKLEGA